MLLHGLLMDASLYDGVIADLSADYRCVAPTLPLVPPSSDARRCRCRCTGLRGSSRVLRPPRPARRHLVGNDTGSALAQLLIGDGAVDMDRSCSSPAARNVP